MSKRNVGAFVTGILVALTVAWACPPDDSTTTVPDDSTTTVPVPVTTVDGPNYTVPPTTEGC